MNITVSKDRYMEGFVTAIIICGLYHVWHENQELKKELAKTKAELKVVKTKNSVVNTVKNVAKKL